MHVHQNMRYKIFYTSEFNISTLLSLLREFDWYTSSSSINIFIKELVIEVLKKQGYVWDITNTYLLEYSIVREYREIVEYFGHDLVIGVI